MQKYYNFCKRCVIKVVMWLNGIFRKHFYMLLLYGVAGLWFFLVRGSINAAIYVYRDLT